MGGSFAINEGDYCESLCCIVFRFSFSDLRRIADAPGSFHIDYGTHAMGISEKGASVPARRGGRKRDWFRAERGRLSGEFGWLDHDHDAHALAEHDHEHVDNAHHGAQDDWNNQFPTGEFCGAMFWLKLNQRFHRLWPDNETFVLEIEREVYNEALTHQAPNGSGIRYFSNLNGIKETPGTIGTCCEGQGTRLYGSLNEYLFSISPGGLYVDIYAPSSITLAVGQSAVTVDVSTEFPFSSGVVVTVTSSPPTRFDLALRMPVWAGDAPIPITVNGVPATSGLPGSYVHIVQVWQQTTAVAFELPRTLVAHAYTGLTPTPQGLTRYAYTVGPILLAATSASRWNSTAKALIIPSVSGASPDTWMTPANDGNGLHYTVAGVSDVFFQPIWEIQGSQVFSSYPAFSS